MSQDIEEPRAGGSYIRHPDGTLELAERTAPLKTRPERVAEAAAQQAAQPAPQAAEEPPADEGVQTPAHHPI
jgi:hypothetical protein